MMFWPPGSVAALGPKKGVAFVAERMTQLVEFFGFSQIYLDRSSAWVY